MNLKDVNFTREEIEQCNGQEFSLIGQSFDYIRLKIQAQGQVLIKQIVDDNCETEDYSQKEACSEIKNDSIDFLWSGLPFGELIKTKQDFFLFFQYKLSPQTFQILSENLNLFQETYGKLINEL